MYKNILSAINEHMNSEVVARYALQMARACGARFHACFIAGGGAGRHELDAAEAALKRLFAEAGEAGVEAEAVTATGDPSKELSRIVRKEGIDLAFVSTRREDVKRRFYAGTAARSISVALPCSVALVRVVHTGKAHPGRILLPLKANINHAAERAFFAAKMALAFEARLFVFHAPRPLRKFFHGEVLSSPLELESRTPRDIVRFIESLGGQVAGAEGRQAPGAIGRAITVEAAARRHDLIIMGASMRSLLQTVIRGNPVEEVLREAPCNLIILKPSHED